MSVGQRCGMVSKEERLSIRRQCVLLGLCRATFYYTPASESDENLKIMELLDSQYAETPFYGYRRLMALLKAKGHDVSANRLRRLMCMARWRTLCPKARTTCADPKACKYPYLLKGLAIDHVNHVWELDISYIPMRRGFMYLFAIIDVHSRYVVRSTTSTSNACGAA